MLTSLKRGALALLASGALIAGSSATSAPLPSNCTLTAYSGTGWTSVTTITGFYPLVGLTANVVFQGPGGIRWGSGGALTTYDATNTLTFQAAQGNHFYWPLNGATWGFVAASCVEGITIQYDAI